MKLKPFQLIKNPLGETEEIWVNPDHVSHISAGRIGPKTGTAIFFGVVNPGHPAHLIVEGDLENTAITLTSA